MCGARVSGEVLFPVDTPVTFRCKELTVIGFVAWVDGPHLGVAFGEPVQPQKALRRRVSPRPKMPAKDLTLNRFGASVPPLEECET